MDRKVKAATYHRRKAPDPSSGLIADVFRNSLHSRDSASTIGAFSSSSSFSAPLSQLRPMTQGGRSALRNANNAISGESCDGVALISSEQTRFGCCPPPLVDSVDEDSAMAIGNELSCCRGDVADPTSGRGLWSATYFGGTGGGSVGHARPESRSLVLHQPAGLPPLRSSNGTPSRALVVAGSTPEPPRATSAASSAGVAPFGHGEAAAGSLYHAVAQRLHKELTLLQASVLASHRVSGDATDDGGSGGSIATLRMEGRSCFLVYREAAHHLSSGMSSYAPVVREVFEAYDAYIHDLEDRCALVSTAQKERDDAIHRAEDAQQRMNASMRAQSEAFQERLATIQNTLRTHKNIESLVAQIRNAENNAETERNHCAELERNFETVARIKTEFESSIRHVEECFQMISNERDIELADYRRAALSAHECVVKTKDECRQTMADMQLRLDAQQIVLETQMQREQLAADRVRDLQLYNLQLLQSVESLKKQLAELNARATSSEVGLSPTNSSPRGPANDVPGGDDEAKMKSQISSVAADLGLDQLNTPRPNKAEMVARVPDLGDPSRYPSTNAIIQALLNQFDITIKRLADADHTLNKLEERIEIVVLARAELLSREKLERMAAEQQQQQQQTTKAREEIEEFDDA